LVTLDPIPLARGSAAKALMAGSSVVPFCSSLTFSAMGVLELKNFSQFALICAAASAVEPVPGLLGAAELGGAGAAGEEADEALDGDPVADEPELLQAATVAASAKPSAGAAIRRARRLNRMTRLRGTLQFCAGLLGITDVLAQSAPNAARGRLVTLP
jgi:hypothetical protein